MLADGRVPSEMRRQTYYEALVRQTQRLSQLVEALLDFGRMEAGTSPYRLQPLDAATWVRSVVHQFSRENTGRGHQVEVRTDVPKTRVSGDGAALTNALWSLLDNAVKYSQHLRAAPLVNGSPLTRPSPPARRDRGRRRGVSLPTPLLPAAGDEVVGITTTPRGLRAHPPSARAGRRRIRTLATPDAAVGDKPSTTDAAGPLREHPQMLASRAENQSGPLLASNPGSITIPWNG